MGLLPAAFGPPLPKNGLAGILYYQPYDIYGCHESYNDSQYPNQTYVGMNKYYNQTFKYASKQFLNDDDENSKIVKQEEELTGGLGTANRAGGANTFQNFLYQLTQYKDSNWWETPILLVRRGGHLDNGDACTFIDKVKNSMSPLSSISLLTYLSLLTPSHTT